MSAVTTVCTPRTSSYAWVAGLSLLALAIPLLGWQMTAEHPVGIAPAVFLTFHTLAEVFAVVVAAMVFITGWHVHDEKRPTVSVMLACAFLAVAILDFAHLMSYVGMADFITENSPHKSIIFWQAARYVAAGALLAYALMPQQPLDRRMRGWYLGASLGFVLALLYVGIWRPEWVPNTFIDGTGLTPFKLAMENGVVALHLLTLGLLYWRRGEFCGPSLNALFFAVALMLASEVFFLVYIRVTDLANVLGHAYKVLAYMFLYRAIFLDSVLAPIVRLRQARSAVEESERRHRELLETAPDAIMVVDGQGIIQMVNERLEQMFGYARSELLGMKMEILVAGRYKARHDDQRSSFTDSPYARPMANKPDLAGQRKDGSEVPLDIALSTFQSDAGLQVTTFIRDVTERRRMEADLRHQATHDALTHLPNRVLFQDRLTQAMVQARRHDRLVAVILLDLDNFKAINDGWGHNYGDLFLGEVAGRLTTVLRPDDMVARLGGDEFVLLLSNPGCVEDVGQVADKIVRLFAEPFRIEENEVFVSASLGVTVFPADGEDVTTLLRNADVAMYRAKSEGRGGIRYYTRDLNTRMRENLLLQTDLRRALENGQLQLHYQAQIEMSTSRISGVEALLRWIHDELGDVSPARFIPVAEASGLIVPIGSWVINTACCQIRAWQDAGMPTKVAVNLSAHQFRYGCLVDVVKTALSESGAAPSLLELELTESALMDDPKAAALVLGELENLGVTIAIDDFGTGYSSLAYLKMFSLHKLKIDRSFVKDVAHDPDDAAIVGGLVSLAHSLGMWVVAEGVETEDQRTSLARLGCNAFQGWLHSRAVPAEECFRMLIENCQVEDRCFVQL
ncbi:EAL domain-containing protein [Thiobacillus sp.]|uniref:bifunctional diguanylate cyclase/phosphodiesterase n=1 Tax=Thiobacillus sp. TaxID=924 RepID=UPI00286DA16D|nr:EAL domain-containing protein [Thiobacillus sp.]